MFLKDLGYNDTFEKYKIDNNLHEFKTGRVITEHKERYIVRTENGDIEAEITGNMRFSASGREDFPAVGDWVALIAYDENFAVIHKIFPRYSVISRQASGRYGEIQIIAANIDYAFLVQAVDRDLSFNRLERYLTLCYSSKVIPIIVLTKVDLISTEKIGEISGKVRERFEDIPVLIISNETQEGYKSLTRMIISGKTYCMLGSSGVGKSTLINNLTGRKIMKTGVIGESTNRGKHVTTHRELVVLDNGGIFIDNPGMREVGITESSDGLDTTFDKIAELSGECKFNDCKHTTEKGCAVLEAVNNGSLSEQAYANYLKMEKERKYFESTLSDRKKRGKELGKLIKNYYNISAKGRG